MISTLLRDGPSDSPATVPLGETGFWIDRAHLADEVRLIRALENLRRCACPPELPADFLNKRKQGFLQNKKYRMEAEQLNEQADALFNEMMQPSPLCLVTGPPGAAKTVVTSLWVNLACEAFPDLHILLIARERPALNRLREKMNVANANAITLRDALDENCVFPDYGCIIVDEASLCGTRDLAVILEKAAASHSRRVILTGDDKQLFPDDVGQPFRWLRENNKAQIVTLTSSFRQKTRELRHMVEKLHCGDVGTALESMQMDFLPREELIPALRASMADRAPEKTLMIVHGDDFVLERLRVLCPGFRIYSLSAAQGLAIDDVILVIAGKINLSELLVGCSRQRFHLDLIVNADVYPDKQSIADTVGEYPKLMMALDVLSEEELLRQAV